MKKLIFIAVFFLVSVFFIGCTTDYDDEIVEKPQTEMHICYFNLVYEQMGRPEISYNMAHTQRYIEYEIENEELYINRPTPSMIAKQFNIPLNDFCPTTHTSCFVDIKNKYMASMHNCDTFSIDQNSGKVGTVKIIYSCWHVN